MTSLFRGTLHDQPARKRYRAKKFKKWKRKLRILMDISGANETLPALLERVRLLRMSNRTLFDDARLQDTLRELSIRLRCGSDWVPVLSAEYLAGTPFTANQAPQIHLRPTTTTPSAFRMVPLTTGCKQSSLSWTVSLKVYKCRGREASKRRSLIVPRVRNNLRKIR